MDIILFMSSMIGFLFSALWLSDNNLPKVFKILVIFCITISIISLISLQFKTTYISFTTSNIIIINNTIIKFNKPIEIKKIIIKRTYGTDMLDEINYEILN